jgi:hypothetical protein
MAEHERTNQNKQGDLDKKHSTRQQESQPSFDKIHEWDQGVISLTEKSFYPRMDKHAAILSRIPFSAQRHEFIMRLNQTYGNRYVQRLIESTKVQAKLTVSDPNDVYEQEADRVADTVTRTIQNPVSRQEEEEEGEEELQTKPVSILQSQEEEEEEPVQMKISQIQRQPEEEEEEVVQGKIEVQRQEEEMVMPSPASTIQRQEEEEIQAQSARSRLDTVPDSIEARINNALGSGQPISDAVKKPMEPAFGIDFSDVRVHTDSEADALNKQLNAKAFTTGKDVFFREGEYSPGSDSGKKLIAHELTHVVQQGGEQNSNDKMTYAQPVLSTRKQVQKKIIIIADLSGQKRGEAKELEAKTRLLKAFDANYDYHNLYAGTPQRGSFEYVATLYYKDYVDQVGPSAARDKYFWKLWKLEIEGNKAKMWYEPPSTLEKYMFIANLMQETLIPASKMMREIEGMIQEREYYWHGTDTLPSEIAAGGGLKTAILRDDPKYALNEDWNPMKTFLGEVPYFRQGKADNELASTISLALNPTAAIKFPILTTESKMMEKPAFNGYPYYKKAYLIVAHVEKGKSIPTWQIQAAKGKGEFYEIGTTVVLPENFIANWTVERWHKTSEDFWFRISEPDASQNWEQTFQNASKEVATWNNWKHYINGKVYDK